MTLPSTIGLLSLTWELHNNAFDILHMLIHIGYTNENSPYVNLKLSVQYASLGNTFSLNTTKAHAQGIPMTCHLRQVQLEPRGQYHMMSV